MRGDAPDLHLDWDERLVGRILRWWRDRKARRITPADARAAELESRLPDLMLLGRLFAGRAITVCASEAHGGAHGDVMRLPTRISAGPDEDANADVYLLRTVIEGTRMRQSIARPTGDAMRDTIELLAEVERALATLNRDFAGFRRRLHRVREWLDALPLPDDLSPQAAAVHRLQQHVLDGGQLQDVDVEVGILQGLSTRGAAAPPMLLLGGVLPVNLVDAIDAQTGADETQALGAIGTEKAASPRDHVERVQLPTDEDVEVMPFHTFEKIECLDDHNGGARQLDGSDELDDHLDAIDEVDLRRIVRGGPPAESVLRAEIEGLGAIPDVDTVVPGETGVTYDEWHQRAGRYRRDWVTVYPTCAPMAADDEWAQARSAVLAPLRQRTIRHLEGMRQARRWTGRQLDGDEIDLDAWIESHAERRAGHPGSQRMYRRNPRRARDIATLVLIDQSLSSDAWIGDRRVLDTTRDAVLVLGDVADALGDRFSVLTFASNTRNRCRVWRVKGWREPWSLGRRRLGALVPTGYTRIGPAIRHATAVLNTVSAEQKLLLLITDGKPNDYDRYEGRYGVADVRQATREAARLGVRMHAIGIDPASARVLPIMFGVGGSQVLSDFSALPETLVDVYRRAT